MQLASHSARAMARAVHAPWNPGSARAIHTPSFLRARPTTTPATIQRFLSQTRHLLGRFVVHLTTPGTLRPTAFQPVARSVHAWNGRAAIQQGLSFPARVALGRPLHGPFLPRPPSIPRSTVQVGLGFARNFSSARPIFQNVVENVPVACRAFWEADWEIKMREERERLLTKPKQRAANQRRRKEMLNPKDQNVISVPAENSEYEAGLERYFAVPSLPDVTTYLLIPIAPTPTSRAPLSLNPPPHHAPHVPFAELGSMHMDYTTHSHRVSSLFARLDAAQVWNRGATSSPYSHGRGHRGVCTFIKVEFAGWTVDEVRSVIGEAGTGWCIMQEVRGGEAVADDLSETSSLLSGMATRELDDASAIHEQGLTQAFVMPTLDFSSLPNVPSADLPTVSPASPPISLLSANSSTSDLFDFAPLSYSDDGWSDTDSKLDFSDGSASWIHANPPPVRESVPAPFGLAFSSDFIRRCAQSA